MTEIPLDLAIIDDEEVVRDTLRDFLERKGHRIRVYADGPAAIAACAVNPPDVALLDIRMPGADGLDVLDRLRERHPELPVIMISGHGTMDTAISAMRRGAADFLRKPIRYPELLAALARTCRLMTVERERDRLRATLARSQAADDDLHVIGQGPACQQVRDVLALAARSPLDGILITGETGTGKDVLARALHRRLRGATAPFVAINCPALPEALVESELFGHMRGAFTGADADRAGAFELADGGTLFLDEVGDLTAAAQAKLLRILENRMVRRLGGGKEVAIDVTVIAATNQDLARMVARSSFRADLLYRLNAFQVALPPLRARSEDIRPLAELFLRQAAHRRRLPDASLAPAALAALAAYPFPGNIRELRHVIERAVLVSTDGRIQIEDLNLPARMDPGPGPSPASGSEADETLAALIRHRWNRRAAARDLHITYEAIRWRIDKYGLVNAAGGAAAG